MNWRLLSVVSKLGERLENEEIPVKSVEIEGTQVGSDIIAKFILYDTKINIWKLTKALRGFSSDSFEIIDHRLCISVLIEEKDYRKMVEEAGE